MARIVLIGGSGHVGTYLVPALADRGHDVVNVSRGTAVPYRPHPAWKAVEQVLMDRTAEESKGTFGSRIAALDADIVIDMISFELDGTQQLVQALHGRADAVRQPVHRSHSAYGYGVPTSAPLASKHWV